LCFFQQDCWLHLHVICSLFQLSYYTQQPIFILELSQRLFTLSFSAFLLDRSSLDLVFNSLPNTSFDLLSTLRRELSRSFACYISLFQQAFFVTSYLLFLAQWFCFDPCNSCPEVFRLGSSFVPFTQISLHFLPIPVFLQCYILMHVRFLWPTSFEKVIGEGCLCICSSSQLRVVVFPHLNKLALLTNAA